MEVFNASELKKTAEVWGSSKKIYQNSSKKIEIGLFSVDPKKSMTMHEHNDADEFIFILDGEASFTVDEKEISLGKGSAILIPKEIQHKAFNNNEKTNLCLYIVCPLE